LQDAVEKAVIATRQLAKRQLTWLRNWPQAIEIKADNQDGFLSTEKICNQTLKVL
jgi:tRNA dimethylallyltransferase